MPKPISLLDMMSEKDRQAALKNYERRMAGETPDHRQKSAPSVKLAAEAGIMFGWQAVVDIKRGYTEGGIPLTLEEVSAIVDAGRKVQYSQEINAARGHQIAIGAALAKNKTKSRQAFETGFERELRAIKEN